MIKRSKDPRQRFRDRAGAGVSSARLTKASLGPAVAVFAGASDACSSRHLSLAQRVGSAIAKAHVALIYGGQRGGLMAQAAMGALAHNGVVVGVCPQNLAHEQCADARVRAVSVSDLAQRKHVMTALADALLVLPGGLGTLDEAVDGLTQARLGVHQSPVIFVDEDGYWDPFFALLDHMSDEGFVAPEAARLALRARGAAQALALCQDVVVEPA